MGRILQLIFEILAVFSIFYFGFRAWRRADVKEKLANVQFPAMMILGGGKNSPTDPFSAVGLESFMRINEGLANSRPPKVEKKKAKTTEADDE